VPPLIQIHPLIPVPSLIRVPPLVLVPLTPASLIPESLTAASPPLAFLALTSRITTNVASLILSFIALIKLVPTFLISPPVLRSPLFS
jgi:hypothetical protein